MKEILFNLLAFSVLLAAFAGCYDTEVDNPYANPNFQSQHDNQLAEEQRASLNFGTVADPISVDDAMQLSVGTDTVYVKGYIVGYIYGTKIASNSIFIKSDTISQAANVLIADQADQKDYTKCIPVQLPTGKIRTAANLKDNPNNFGQEVVFGGVLQTYFSVTGIKNTFYVKINGVETGGVVQAVDNNAPQPVVTYIDEPFSESMGDFRHRTVANDSTFDVWTFTKYGMVASAYANKKDYAAEAWLISPPVDLTGKTAAYFTFDHAAAYFGDNNLVGNACEVLVSVDSTNWETLQIVWPQNSNGKSYTFVNSGIVNLSQYVGKSSVRIAFKYTSTAEKAGTWEIKNVKLQETEPEIAEPVIEEHAAEASGDGTRDNPYNISYIQQNTIDDYVWIKGVIVGYVSSTKNVTFSVTGAVNTNIAIADADTVKSVFNCTSVKLASGDIRDMLNLKDNPGNYLKTVLMYAKVAYYFGFDNGIIEIKYAEIDGNAAGVDPEQTLETITDVIEGDNNLSEKETITYEDLSTSQGKFTSYCVSKNGALANSNIWTYNSNGYMKGSAYVSSTNYDSEAWLISPEIDLSNAPTNISLSFSQSGQYFEVDVKTSCSVLISTDYTSGNPNSATWTSLEISEWPTTVKTFVENTVDISSYSGKSIRIAFKYTSNETKAGTWEIKNFKVAETDNGTGSTTDPTSAVDKGKYENPYTCADLLAMTLTTSSSDKGYVKGYIIGSVNGNSLSSSTLVLGTEGASTSNVLIADSPTETDYEKCVSVKGSTAIKNEIYLSNNVDALGKTVLLYGTIKMYLGTSGLNTATYCELYSDDGTYTSYGTKPE